MDVIVHCQCKTAQKGDRPVSGYRHETPFKIIRKVRKPGKFDGCRSNEQLLCRAEEKVKAMEKN